MQESIEAAPDEPLPREVALLRARRIPKHQPNGRPLKLDDKLASNLLDRISKGAYLSVACEAVGTSSEAVSVWLRRGLADLESQRDTRFGRFVRAYHRARADHEIELARKVEGKTDEDWRAGAFVLERRYRERWGKNESPSIAAVTLNLSPEQGEIVVELLRMANAKRVTETVTVTDTVETATTDTVATTRIDDTL